MLRALRGRGRLVALVTALVLVLATAPVLLVPLFRAAVGFFTP